MPAEPDIVQVKVEGKPITNDVHEALAFVRVEQSVTLADRFELQFNDPNFELLDGNPFKIGADVEVSFRDDGRLVSVSQGVVTSVSSEAGQDSSEQLIVNGLDASFELTLEPKSRTFLKQDGSQIASKIAKEYGLKAATGAAPFKYQYLIQHNETDYEFLQRIADENGFRFWVTDKELHFESIPSSRSPVQLEMYEDLLKINLRMTAANRADSAEASFWDEKQKTVITATATSPGKVTYADSNLLTQVEKEASKGFKKTKLVTGHLPVDEQAKASAIADSRLRYASAGQVILKGEAIGSPKIRAGEKVSIRGAGKTIRGNFLLTSAEHVYGANITYVTRFTAGEREPAGLVDLLGGTRQSQGNAYSPWGQILNAVVTNVEDPENYGRVKVKFGTLGKDEESDWARVLAPGAGSKTGFQIMPEVTDEVLVGFEYGDPRRPIVLGGLWNGKDKPPDDSKTFFKNGKVVKRTWKTSQGNSIEFFDGSGAADKKIVITDGGSKATISMTENGIELKTTGGKHKVSVDSAGDVEVQSKKNISVSGQKVTVEGKTGLELSGGKIDIKAKGNVTIKGAMIALN